MGLGFRIAVGTLPVAKGTIALVPAGPEGKRVGLDIGVDFEDIGLQGMVAGPSAGRVVRPDSALAGLCIRPEGPFDCCIQREAAGYMLGLLLLLRARQPPHFSSAHRLRERVL